MYDVLVQDLRYAVRMLWKHRTFTAIAVISLGLGVGANTAIFSLADALLLRPLPVQEPERLVFVQRTSRTTGKPTGVNREAFEAMKQLHQVFVDVAMYSPLGQSTIGDDRRPESGRLAVGATDNFFQVLGVRTLSPSGNVTASFSSDRLPAVVVSDRLWRARNASERDRALIVNGRSYSIIGVAPPEFLGISLDASVDAWLLSSPPNFVPPSAIARLQRGITTAQAHAATAAMFEHLDRQQGRPVDSGTVVQILPAARGASTLREQYRWAVWTLTALAILVLLVTCANIANLLVARNVLRTREFTMRAALGASRTRLAMQLLVESAVIALVSGVIAWLVARWGVLSLLAALPLSAVPEQLEFRTDLRMLGVMAALTISSAMIFATAPAWRASRVDTSSSLKTTSNLANDTHRGRRLWLVSGYVGLSLVLVSGASLFVRTLANLAAVDLGFDTSHLVQIELADRAVRYRPDEVPGVYTRLIENVEAIPGVAGVTTYGSPLFPQWWVGVPEPSASSGIVGPRFFETLGIPLVRGRLFTPDDARRHAGVAVVSESFAREMFPGEEIIGKRAGHGNLEVVGVVRDANLDNLRWGSVPTVYRQGIREEQLILSALLVQANSDPSTLLEPIRRAVADVNPRLFVSFRTVDDVINRSIARERMVAMTGGFFGGLAAVLAGIGIFGVAALGVARRTSELGIRMALGASRWHMVRTALRETTQVFGLGLMAGAIAAFAVARIFGSYVSGLLFGLDAADWTSVAISALAMVIVGLGACLAPVVRAIRIDPLIALRQD
jgi:putative ABC transport system permease protein